MKEFKITLNDSNQRLDKFLEKAIPLLPKSLQQKYIRIKRIKLNGARTMPTYKLCQGDILQCYINDEFFIQKEIEFCTNTNINIVYEDENILLVDKPVGILSHSEDEKNTLIDMIIAYLHKNGEYFPEKENSFTPALCNRIDRNTSGIVISAKNSMALKIANDKIKRRLITKKYLCITVGENMPKHGKIENFILKSTTENRVFISKNQVRGSKTAITLFKLLKTKGELNLVECELITGRTHQIRAHFSNFGFPLLGDSKYGDNKINRKYKEKYQALCSYFLEFNQDDITSELDYLQNQKFIIKNISFVQKYFT